MPRIKHTHQKKMEIIKRYLSGEGSYDTLSQEYDVGFTTLRTWVSRYREHGEAAFIRGCGNSHYSTAFKKKCVQAVVTGEGSIDDIVAKYNISDRKVLRSWIMKYNANMELKDYEPKREVYMAEARRKTTLEERKEIVAYCISHNNDYKGAASKFEVSYSQVYSWVKKYRTDGESALEDKRGHHKREDELDELERLRRENQRLKKQLEERDMLCELLKKVRELGGM